MIPGIAGGGGWKRKEEDEKVKSGEKVICAAMRTQEKKMRATIVELKTPIIIKFC